MEKKIILRILKIISIILVLMIEVMVFLNYWVGHDLLVMWSPIKTYIILTIIIAIITIIDKVIITIFELGKGVVSKQFRISKVNEIKTDLRCSHKPATKFLKLLHLMIFSHLWLVVLVFGLHSSEWIINGISFIQGKVENVLFYSVIMRVVEYPIVIITLVFDFFKNAKEYKSYFKK